MTAGAIYIVHVAISGEWKLLMLKVWAMNENKQYD